MFKPLAMLLPTVFSCTALLCGCGGGGSDLPMTAYVEGIVTLDGAPLSDVVVAFQPQGAEGGRAAIGRTGGDGRYVLKFNADIEGAIIGSHKVTVTTPSEAPDPSGIEKDPIPARYNVNTELTADVKPESNDIPFALTSK